MCIFHREATKGAAVNGCRCPGSARGLVGINSVRGGGESGAVVVAAVVALGVVAQGAYKVQRASGDNGGVVVVAVELVVVVSISGIYKV